MTFWLKVLAGYAVLAALLIFTFGLDWRSGIDLLLVACAFLPAVVKHVPRLYLFLSRLKYSVTNAETTWSLSMSFDGSFDREQLYSLVEQLARANPAKNRILYQTDTQHLLQYAGFFTVEFLLTMRYEELASSHLAGSLEEAHHLTLGVTVYEQQVSYRRTRRALEEILVPLFETIKDSLKPDSGLYTLAVGFDGQNPFFGLYLEQMRLDLVREFTFVFQLPATREGDYVRVGKDKMTIVSSSLEGFRRLALAGLTFSVATR